MKTAPRRFAEKHLVDCRLANCHVAISPNEK